MTDILGSKRFIYLDQETGAGSAWGTEPTTPVLVHVPFNSWDVKLNRNVAKHTPMIGLGQRAHAQAISNIPQGQIVVPFIGYQDSGIAKSLAQYLIEWALGDGSTVTLETLDARPSMTAYDIQKDGSGNQISSHKQSGLRVGKLTVKGSASDGFITITLDVMGKTDIIFSGTPNALPDNRNKLLEALFTDMTFTLGGSAMAIESFEWSVDFGLKAAFLNSFTPQKLSAMHCQQSLQVTPLKDSSTYDAYQRLQASTELTAVLAIKALHNGTGTGGTNYTVGTFTFNRVSLLNSDQNLPLDDFGKQPLTLEILKPDTSSAEVVPVWSEAA